MIDMTTVEQRINYFHLLDGVLFNAVKGDVIELGCFTGQCAVLFQEILQANNSEKKLHLYDSFEKRFTVEDILIRNFRKKGLSLPVIHKGYFETTIPQQLPEHIAFAHIDCGFGGDLMEHKKIMLYCLNAIYPRLSQNAVCVLMDYHNPNEDDFALDANPGVKLACDEFFISKPEKVFSLYGNQYAHGFFRKA
jgi:O-methyltransferase